MPQWWESTFQDDWTLAKLIGKSAERNAFRPALLAGDGEVYSHGDISNCAKKLRGAILAHADPGTVVAILNTLDLPCFASVQAVITSDCILAPLDAEAPDDRNRRNMQHVGAKVLVTNADRREQALRLAGTSCRVVVFEDITGDEETAIYTPAPSDTAAYVFTSGRSGAARAVIRTHRDLAHAVYCISKNLCRYSPDDRMLVPGSPGHVGSLNDILSCLMTGFMALPVDISAITLQGLLKLIQRNHATVLGLPPSLLRAMTPILGEAKDQLQLRLVVTSGEALLRRDVRNFFEAFPRGVELWQNYGSTETGPICASRYTVSDSHGKDPLPLRTLHDDCLVEILDANCSAVRNGTQGRIRVCSPYISRGYLKANEEDSKRFMTVAGKDAFLIGDLGSFAETGELFVAGRSDRQFSRNGRRFEASEVEAAALAHPGIQEAVLVPGSDGSSTSFVLAVSVVPGHEVDVSEIRRGMSNLISKAILPHRIIVLQSMPRTAGGKVDYRAVQHQLDSMTVAPIGTGGPPRGRLENWIADCWQDVLKVARPGRDEPFESLGGSSLNLIELSWMLESRFGLRLGPENWVEATTIAKQASQASEQQTEEKSPFVTLHDDHEGPFVLMLPGIGGHAWVFAELCRRLCTPATCVAVNYAEMFSAIGDQNSRKHIAEYLAAAIMDRSGERATVAIGYSLGGVLANDINMELDASGHKLTACLLLDPARLAKNRSRSSLLTELRRLKDYFSGRTHENAIDERVASLEKELVRVSRQLKQAYSNAEPIERSAGTDVICSEESMEDDTGDPIRASVRANGDAVIPCKHLDLLRIPYVTETARHVDEVLARIGE